jgi:hypothetical protein
MAVLPCFRRSRHSLCSVTTSLVASAAIAVASYGCAGASNERAPGAGEVVPIEAGDPEPGRCEAVGGRCESASTSRRCQSGFYYASEITMKHRDGTVDRGPACLGEAFGDEICCVPMTRSRSE